MYISSTCDILPMASGKKHHLISNNRVSSTIILSKLHERNRVSMMNHKDELLNFVRNTNMLFHFGILSTQEKNLLVQDARTGFLSKTTASMLQEKMRSDPENSFLLEVMDFFGKENETC